MQRFDDNSVTGMSYTHQGATSVSMSSNYDPTVLYPTTSPFGVGILSQPALPARVSPITVPAPPMDFWAQVANRTAELLAGRTP